MRFTDFVKALTVADAGVEYDAVESPIDLLKECCNIIGFGKIHWKETEPTLSQIRPELIGKIVTRSIRVAPVTKKSIMTKLSRYRRALRRRE